MKTNNSEERQLKREIRWTKEALLIVENCDTSHEIQDIKTNYKTPRRSFSLRKQQLMPTLWHFIIVFNMLNMLVLFDNIFIILYKLQVITP